MTTKVIIFSGGFDRKPLSKNYYKENSRWVLTKLIENGYHIKKYDEIETMHSSILKTAEVKSIDKETGLRTTKSIDEIVLNEGDFTKYNPKPEEIMKDFIKTYLIEVVDVKEGSQTIGPGQRVIDSNFSIVKNVSYFTARKKIKNKDREIYLQNILDYGKALFGKGFNMKELEKRINAVKKEMPTKVEPTRTYFATLNIDKEERIILD